jgi:hypothetical protein
MELHDDQIASEHGLGAAEDRSPESQAFTCLRIRSITSIDPDRRRGH